MLTFSDAVIHEARSLIEDRKKTLIENVVAGLAIQTIEQYREHVGRIAGLNEASDLLEEARANVNKRM